LAGISRINEANGAIVDRPRGDASAKSDLILIGDGKNRRHNSKTHRKAGSFAYVAKAASFGVLDR
jgi:hypothetical protein